jgi:hypothetical protein
MKEIKVVKVIVQHFVESMAVVGNLWKLMTQFKWSIPAAAMIS